MKRVLLLSLFAVLILLISTVRADIYQVDWYSTAPDCVGCGQSSPNPTISWTPSFFSDATGCTLGITPYGTINTTSSFTSISSYYSPGDVLIAQSERSITSNITCSTYGTSETTNQHTTGTYDAKISTIIGTSDAFITQRTNAICSSPGSWITFTVNNDTRDSRGLIPNIYRSAESPITHNKDTAINYLRRENFNPCNWTRVYVRDNMSISGSGRTSYWWHYFVFNSMDMGLLNISLYTPVLFKIWVGQDQLDALDYEVYIYELDFPEGNYSICSTLPCHTEVALNRNTDYVLLIEYLSDHPDTPGVRTVEIIPNYTIRINSHTPIWSCGNWSACSDGVRWRNCEDTEGIAPDQIETMACYSGPDEELWLGFYGQVTRNVWYSFLEWTCLCSIRVRSINYPDDWTANPSYLFNYTNYGTPPVNTTAYLYDYLKMTNEYSADGDSRCLKMWYIPPKANMPQGMFNPDVQTITCGNETAGAYPTLEHAFNESLFVERNVTFPSPYMTLFFNVRKCAKPEPHYLGPWWFFFQPCGPNTCYTHSGNCTEVPKGRILTQVVDADTSEIIFNDVTNVQETATWEAREYLMDELNITHNYTLRFALVPPAANVDPDSYCIYLDNVNFYVRDEPLVCQSYCDEDIYGLLHRATNISGACVYKQIQLSPVCVDDEEIIERIAEHESFCDPGCESSNYRYYRWDNETLVWEITENSFYCREWCITEAEEEEMTESDIENITEAASFFLTPMFISILVSLGIGGLIGAKTQQASLAVLTVMILLLGFTFVGFFPSWIFMVVIIIAGFLFAKGMLGSFKGS